MPANEVDTEALLTLRNVSKRFGGVDALRQVDFTVTAGEVHVLLGENGAGKSTLMNVISGAISDYDGEMRLEGRPVRFASPNSAQKAGIATVRQELDLVSSLTVADNLFLGVEVCRVRPFVDKAAMRRLADQMLERVGGGVSSRATVGDLRLGHQQLVAIAKALSADAKILILDEPTAALPTHEVEILFTLMRRLRTQGVGIIFISHRLDEIERIGDRVTVMRDGSVVATVPADTPPAELGALLTGRAAEEMFPPRAKQHGKVRLRLTDFAFTPRRTAPNWQAPSGVNLTVHAGEVVGLVGLLGSGRTELLQSIYGSSPAGRRKGEVQLDGRTYGSLTIKSGLRRGIGFVPDDRRADGLVSTFDVAQNLALASLTNLSRLGVIRPRKVQAAVDHAFRSFGIKANSSADPIMSLSGGNQQKVLIGRALMRNPRLLLLDEPTRGIDVGAKADVYRLVRALTEEGLAVLVASNELLELIGWCDRLVVMRGGRAVAELAPDAEPSLINALVSNTPLEEAL